MLTVKGARGAVGKPEGQGCCISTVPNPMSLLIMEHDFGLLYVVVLLNASFPARLNPSGLSQVVHDSPRPLQRRGSCKVESDLQECNASVTN